jgi:hypothetical protein
MDSRAACRLWDCMFGKAPAAPCAQTTYAPPYVPAPVYTAPAAACQPCIPTCTPCTPCTPCAPQTCQYMAASPIATVAYSPYVAYSPAVVTAYQPVVDSYAVTRYRPFLGTYETRLVPYTTYRPYVASAIAYSPCASCAACAPSPCAGCGSCGGGSSCGSGGCGSVAYEVPSSGCSGCGNVVAAPTPAPGYSAVPAPVADQSGPPRTFKGEESHKPVPDTNGSDTNKELNPIPAPTSDTKPSSMSAPKLPDPNDRTASRSPAYSTVRIQTASLPVKQPVKRPPVEDNDGWYAPKD